MLINGLDHRTFGVMSYDKDIETAEVITYDEWLRNAPTPIAIGQKELYKAITVKFFLRGASVQEVTEKISNLAAALRRCTLKFDKLNFYYDCTLVSTKTEKHNGLQQVFTANLKSGYAYQDNISTIANGVNSIAVNNPGNLPAMAVVSITPTIGLGAITVGSFTVTNPTAGKTVIVDGEQFHVTENGVNKYGDFTGDFLTIQPGNNAVSISSTSCNITIKIKPKWM